MACHLNMAAAALKLRDYPLVIEHASRVLAVDPHNIKALCRRAMAYLYSDQTDLTAADLLVGTRVDREGRGLWIDDDYCDVR